MWLNQDQMFATDKNRMKNGVDVDKKAIEFLDSLACRIADGDVHVENIEFSTDIPTGGPVWHGSEKKFEVIYK